MRTVISSLVLSAALLSGCGSSDTSVGNASPSSTSKPGNGGNGAGGEGGGPGSSGSENPPQPAVIAVPADCEAEITGAPGDEAKDFFRAMGVCGAPLVSARIVRGENASRVIRSSFGKNFAPRQGQKMVHLSTGEAKDNSNGGLYTPDDGAGMSAETSPHPLWAPANCGNPSRVSQAFDVTELEATLQVPANAKSFQFDINYFTAEYPEWVCTEFNDRFIAILESDGLDPSKLPGGAANNCVPGTARPTCNISFDSKGQHVTVNNGFFSICDSQPGLAPCSEPGTQLEDTGYDLAGIKFPFPRAGGATGWLTTESAVQEGETLKLRFIVLDEGDNAWDSAVLLDNFRWSGGVVEAPNTQPVLQ